MDTKRLLTTALIAMAVMLLFEFFMRGKGGQGAGAAAAAAAGANPIYQNLPSAPTAAVGESNPPVEAGAKNIQFTLGSAKASDPDKLAIRINPITAAIDLAQLNIRDYTETVENKKPLTLFDVSQFPDGVRPFATIGVHVVLPDGQELRYGVSNTKDASTGKAVLHDLDSDSPDIAKANSTFILDRQYLWKLTPGQPDAGGVVHEATLLMTLQANNAPFVAISKTFREDPKTYDVTITHTVKNLSNQPIHVAIDQLGAPNFFRDDPRADDRYFHAAGLDTAKAALSSDAFNLMQMELGKVSESKPVGQMDDFKNNPILWVASSNRFFAAIIRPLPETGNSATFKVNTGDLIPEPGHIKSADIDRVTADPKPSESLAIIRFTGASIAIPAGGSISEPLTVYLGPKQRESLKGSLGAKPGTQQYDYAVYDYADIVQFTRGCWIYSFCVFPQMVDAFLWALEFLKRTVAFGNYGLAIMILVIIIRALLHPLTRAGQINMAKMGKKMKDVAPKVEAIKKKYADNKRKQSEEMMRIYRENHVNPAGGVMGCLPMLIQTPIWIAAWSGIASDINLRHQAFIPGWINDLSNPDTVFPHAATVMGHPIFTIPVLNFDIYGLNLLPILLAVVMFLNAKVTMATQPRSADPQQAQMQKISSYMVFLLPLFLYNASSGLNLYYFASTMAGLVDTYFVRKSLKKQGILPTTAQTLPTHEEED